MSTDKKEIIIDTGNIFNLAIKQPKILQNPTAEILEGINQVLDACASNLTRMIEIEFERDDLPKMNCIQIDPTLVFSGSNNHQMNEQSKLKYSIKLFIFPEIFDKPIEYKEIIIEEAVGSLCQILDTKQIDSLIFSIQTNDVNEVVPNIQSLWNCCQKLVKKGKIGALGTSDLNASQLSELHSWTKSTGCVPPSSTQINLDFCCDIPADLSAFSKENSIQLLTHKDPNENFLPVDQLKEMFKSKNDVCPILSKLISSTTTTDSTNDDATDNDYQLKRKWIARYTLTLPGQGVVKSKGYLISLKIE